jgi:hypothetical protein
VPTGYTTEYEEGIDIDQTKVNGGAPGAALTDGTIASIDSNRLPRDPAKGCAPVWPWQFVRANTIFSVVHQHGGITAWSDKHPAYSSVASGVGPAALSDFYAPEINSNVVALPGVTLPSGTSCASVLDPNSDLTAWTNSFQNIQCYDQLKVNAILNWIDGKTHLGGGSLNGTPDIFGMNFQAVSVGQKLIESSNTTTGGCLDAAGTPSAALLSEFQFVDASIAAFVSELKKRDLYDSALIVITAKHGQSPIDPSLYKRQHGANGIFPATLISNQLNAAMPPSEDPNGSGIGSTEDDVLAPLADESVLHGRRRGPPRGQSWPDCHRRWAVLLRPVADPKLQRPDERSRTPRHHRDPERRRDLLGQPGEASRARRIRA